MEIFQFSEVGMLNHSLRLWLIFCRCYLRSCCCCCCCRFCFCDWCWRRCCCCSHCYCCCSKSTSETHKGIEQSPYEFLSTCSRTKTVLMLVISFGCAARSHSWFCCSSLLFLSLLLLMSLSLLLLFVLLDIVTVVSVIVVVVAVVVDVSMSFLFL